MNLISTIITRSKSRLNSNLNITSDLSNISNDSLSDIQNLLSSTDIPEAEMNSSDNIKLPKFWMSCPETWFVQIESIFTLKGINDDKIKYLHVITSLPEDVITNISDVVQDPPTVDKFKFIKSKLIQRYSLSDDNRFEKVLNESQLGDRKPSELFRDMKTLANSVLGEDVVFKLWVRKLPKHIQTHIASSSIEEIEEKLKLADKIYDIYMASKSNEIFEVNKTECTDKILVNLVETTSLMCENFNKLKIEIAELKNKPKGFNNFHKKNTFQGEWCWYHKKFGNNAQKCVSPCTYKYKKHQNSTNLN